MGGTKQIAPKVYDQMTGKHIANGSNKAYNGGSSSLNNNRKIRTVSSDVMQKIQEFKRNPSSYEQSQGSY